MYEGSILSLLSGKEASVVVRKTKLLDSLVSGTISMVVTPTLIISGYTFMYMLLSGMAFAPSDGRVNLPPSLPARLLIQIPQVTIASASPRSPPRQTPTSKDYASFNQETSRVITLVYGSRDDGGH